MQDGSMVLDNSTTTCTTQYTYAAKFAFDEVMTQSTTHLNDKNTKINFAEITAVCVFLCVLRADNDSGGINP